MQGEDVARTWVPDRGCRRQKEGEDVKRDTHTLT